MPAQRQLKQEGDVEDIPIINEDILLIANGGTTAQQVSAVIHCTELARSYSNRKVAIWNIQMDDPELLWSSSEIKHGRCTGCGVKVLPIEDDELWDYCECPDWFRVEVIQIFTKINPNNYT